MIEPEILESGRNRVTVEKINSRVEIFLEGDMVIETRHALKVSEPKHDPVIYVPRDEIKNLQFIKYDDYNSSLKGVAELYHVKHNSHIFEKAAWSYVQPSEDVIEIKNYIAFDPNRVQAIKVTGHTGGRYSV